MTQATLVRWRNTPRRRWRYGRLRRTLSDGNVEVIDERTGALRTLRPDAVEYKAAGPRGGVVWLAATLLHDPRNMTAPTWCASSSVSSSHASA